MNFSPKNPDDTKELSWHLLHYWPFVLRECERFRLPVNYTHRWQRSGLGSQWNKHRKASFFDHSFYLVSVSPVMLTHALPPWNPPGCKMLKRNLIAWKISVQLGQRFICFKAYLLNTLVIQTVLLWVDDMNHTFYVKLIMLHETNIYIYFG